MAESTCLHIQDRESGPIRIVELPWISVRVGRAAFCEVRLSDPDLPEEACRLHRRGRAWHLTPLIGSGVCLDGRPVETPLALPFDVPFQVGRFTLSLKSSKFAEPDWRPPHAEPSRPRSQAPAPPASQSPTANPWEARWRAAGDRLKAARAAEAPPVPAPEPTPAPPPPRDVRRPAAPRAEPPRYGPAPHSWTSPTPRPAARPRPAWEGPSPRPRDAEARRAAPSTSPSPTVARHPSPLAGETGRRPYEGGSAGYRSRPPQTPLKSPSSRDRRREEETPTPAAPETASPSPLERPDVLGPLVGLLMLPAPATTDAGPTSLAGRVETQPEQAAAPADRAPAQPADPEPQPPAVLPLIQDFEPPASRGDGVESPAAAVESLSARLEAMDLADLAPAAPSGPIRRRLPRRLFLRPEPPAAEAPAVEPAPRPEPESVPVAEPSWAYSPHVQPMSTTTTAGPSRRFVADTSYGFEPFDADVEFELPSPAPTPAPQARRAADYEEEDPEAFDPTRARRSRAEEPWVLPSVQDVLGASARRVREREAAGPVPRPAARFAGPVPTRPTPPSHWSLPSWVAAPPALALLLGVGGLLGLGSWRQATVSHQASAIIRTAAGFRLGTDKDRVPGEGVAPPSPSWWGVAPSHLAQWGVYLDGARVEHGLGETAPAMLEAAAASSPLEPVSRLTSAHAAGEGSPALGLSRDAAGLAWTGRTLHKAGKDGEAVRAYRRALEIAARTGPTSAGPLVYSDNASRYLLPGEALASAVAADLAADASWSYRDWSAAVPESGVAALAVARSLKKQGKPEADAILKRILDRAEANARARADALDEPSADPEAEAVGLAVAAEALALRADWKEAERRYRAAIDLMPDHRVRRSWWFNLADVALRIGDDDQRRAALDEALASTAADDVSRRALELQGGGVEQSRTNRLGAVGPRAN